jgi:hypothetical protein
LVTVGAGVVGAGVVGAAVDDFGAAAGAVTVWVTAGAAAGTFAEPHAARLIPATNAMAGIATTLLSFIVAPSPSADLISLSVGLTIRSVHHGGQSRMTGKSGPNDRAKMTGKVESNVTSRDRHQTLGN